MEWYVVVLIVVALVAFVVLKVYSVRRFMASQRQNKEHVNRQLD